MSLPISVARVAELMADLRPDGDQRSTPGCVEGAISNAILAAHYHQGIEDPDILHVAAYLLRSLAQNHCFQDGNKRIAWTSAVDVLWVGAHLTITADQEEAAAMVNQVATGNLDVDGVINWIAERLVEQD